MQSLCVATVVTCLGACGFSAGGGQANNDAGDDTAIDARSDGASDAEIDASPGSDAMPLPPLRRFTVAHRSETLTGFPVWISIDDAALATQSGSATPYFTHTDGTAIPYEIQQWSAGHLDAWVRADIDVTNGAAFDLHPGDALTTHPAQPAAVFAAPFAAVWHFDATAGTLLGDARGTNNGTAVGSSGGLPAAATGKLGSGLSFDGTDDEVSITNPFAGDTAHTFSAWVSSTTTAGNGTIVTLGDPSGDHARWFHTRFPNLSSGFYNGNDFRPTDAGTQLAAGFHLVHWTYDKAADRRSRLYIDGVLVGTSPSLTATNNTMTTVGHIGNAPAGFGASAFKGTLDEVRLATQIRSAAWISSEYANQSAPTSFYTVSMIDQ
ncbi:MAG TPA: LamG-like jellyroll fold domain-containing protein [Kofleriaceae bacterium]